MHVINFKWDILQIHVTYMYKNYPVSSMLTCTLLSLNQDTCTCMRHQTTNQWNFQLQCSEFQSWEKCEKAFTILQKTQFSSDNLLLLEHIFMYLLSNEFCFQDKWFLYQRQVGLLGNNLVIKLKWLLWK